jgi:chromosome segregation ATPase
MSRSTGFVAAILTVVIIGAALVPGPHAQQPAPLQTELLTEVRLLRQAIEGLAGTNARVQIVFGRLQLQEQRTATASRRLDDLRAAIGVMATRAGEMSDRIKELEDALSDSRSKPEQLDALRQELTMARHDLARIEGERARLMGEEVEAAGHLNQEQGRWVDLNRQLEELERALAPRPQ